MTIKTLEEKELQSLLDCRDRGYTNVSGRLSFNPHWIEEQIEKRIDKLISEKQYAIAVEETLYAYLEMELDYYRRKRGVSDLATNTTFVSLKNTYIQLEHCKNTIVKLKNEIEELKAMITVFQESNRLDGKWMGMKLFKDVLETSIEETKRDLEDLDVAIESARIRLAAASSLPLASCAANLLIYSRLKVVNQLMEKREDLEALLVKDKERLLKLNNEIEELKNMIKKPAAIGGIEIKEGQVWKDGENRLYEITHVDSDSNNFYPIHALCKNTIVHFTKEGKFYGFDSDDHKWDLVKLVADALPAEYRTIVVTEDVGSVRFEYESAKPKLTRVHLNASSLVVKPSHSDPGWINIERCSSGRIGSMIYKSDVPGLIKALQEFTKDN